MEEILHHSPQKELTLRTPSSKTAGLRSRERIHLCCLKPPHSWYCVGAAPGHDHNCRPQQASVPHGDCGDVGSQRASVPQWMEQQAMFVCSHLRPPAVT